MLCRIALGELCCPVATSQQLNMHVHGLCALVVGIEVLVVQSGLGRNMWVVMHLLECVVGS